jgi:hypothetical protein
MMTYLESGSCRKATVKGDAEILKELRAINDASCNTLSWLKSTTGIVKRK